MSKVFVSNHFGQRIYDGTVIRLIDNTVNGYDKFIIRIEDKPSQLTITASYYDEGEIVRPYEYSVSELINLTAPVIDCGEPEFTIVSRERNTL